MAVDFARLDRALNPRTIVVFGDKNANEFLWLNSLRNFPGKLYSVQVDSAEMEQIEAMGVTNFTSLADVPGPIDYGIVAVPRSVAGRILADCIEYDVGAVTMFTAGFAETGTDDGREAQDRIEAMATEAGMVLIGPNCMGLHNPSLGIGFSVSQEKYEGGNVGFASQSGSHAIAFSLAGPANGIKISKMVSFGNGILLENADYLEYFAQDPQTEVIAMYVEGLHDGRRFFDLLKKTTPRKPVVIWKGGQTEEGKRATASHTASLAESMAVWEAVARQTGAILVETLEEAVDTVKALLYLPPVTGYGCGLTGGAGGQSVSLTDAFAKAGMAVPALSEDSYKTLAEFFSLVGASFRNPIDMGSNRREIDTILDILAGDPVIDIVVVQMGSLLHPRSRKTMASQADALIKLRERTEKPVVAIPYSAAPHREAELLAEIEIRVQDAGIPAFPSFQRAGNALKNVVGYHRGLAGL